MNNDGSIQDLRLVGQQQNVTPKTKVLPQNVNQVKQLFNNDLKDVNNDKLTLQDGQASKIEPGELTAEQLAYLDNEGTENDIQYLSTDNKQSNSANGSNDNSNSITNTEIKEHNVKKEITVTQEENGQTKISVCKPEILGNGNAKLTITYSDGHTETVTIQKSMVEGLDSIDDWNSEDAAEFLNTARELNGAKTKHNTASGKLEARVERMRSFEERMGALMLEGGENKLQETEEFIKVVNGYNPKLPPDFEITDSVKKAIKVGADAGIKKYIGEISPDAPPEQKMVAAHKYEFLISATKEQIKTTNDPKIKQVLNSQLDAFEKSYSKSGVKDPSYLQCTMKQFVKALPNVINGIGQISPKYSKFCASIGVGLNFYNDMNGNPDNKVDVASLMETHKTYTQEQLDKEKTRLQNELETLNARKELEAAKNGTSTAINDQIEGVQTQLDCISTLEEPVSE